MAKKPTRPAKPKKAPSKTRPASKAPARKAASPPRAAAPAPRAADLGFVRELSNAVAVSGDEGAVRKLVLDAVRPHVDEVKVDALGNVLAVKHGAGGPRAGRVLVAAHMDEVGFMVSGHDSDGSLRFEIVGGIDERALIGKPVFIGANKLPGMVGGAPVHLLTPDRRMTVVKAAQLRIDIGADSAEAAKRLVKIGERGAFATEFDVLGGVSLRGKALDDRLGCATLVELLRGGPYPFEFHAAFTVQEEVGLRGAKVAGYAANPNCAFVLDCTPANDLPHTNPEIENTQYNARLGLGPAIYVADRSTLYDERLVRFVRKTAEAAGIPYQIRQPGGGGTDAGAIHLAREGVPTVSISVPGRYLHTPAAIARLDDWRSTVALMKAVLAAWTPKALK
jgi:endoglucanase